MQFTKHFIVMLEERAIREEWVDAAVNDTDMVEDHEDGTRHFLKKIEEHGN